MLSLDGNGERLRVKQSHTHRDHNHAGTCTRTHAASHHRTAMSVALVIRLGDVRTAWCTRWSRHSRRPSDYIVTERPLVIIIMYLTE